MSWPRGPSAWTRRGLLALVLVGAALIPGHVPGGAAAPRCPRPRCGPAGGLRWTRALSGSWTAEGGIVGTVPAAGQAFVAAGPQVAALGSGTQVDGYAVRTGKLLWATALAGFGPGASIVSVRSWPGVVTAGVAYPDPGTGAMVRDEVVLDAGSGRPVRRYRAAAYGGAVAADRGHTVIVGNKSVTSYDNATGRPAWSRPTGPEPQAWRVDDGDVYVTVAAAGYLGTAPVTALRRISLATGRTRLIRAAHGSYAGTLSAVFDGVLLFSGPAGLSGYSEATGELLWRREGVVAESEDPIRRTLYVTRGSGLTGLNPRTGAIKGPPVPGSSGLYGVRNGVALGLDQGALGAAWGYSVAEHRVVWTTSPLPWPHYFVDLSGIGGSADPSSRTVLLAACAALGGRAATGNGQACLRPELVAISR